ncbi:hypothetical protein, partial [Mesorhizobium sp. A556]
ILDPVRQFGGQNIPMTIEQRLLGGILEHEEKLRAVIAPHLYFACVQFEDAMPEQRKFVLKQEVVERSVIWNDVVEQCM